MKVKFRKFEGRLEWIVEKDYLKTTNINEGYFLIQNVSNPILPVSLVFMDLINQQVIDLGLFFDSYKAVDFCSTFIKNNKME